MIPEKYRGDEEMIRLTVEQIKKDFGNHLPDPVFSGQKEKLFDELALQISTALKDIYKSNPALFKVILYRVDVKESDIPAALGSASLQVLSERIIQREFQKVLTRRFFSGGNQ